MAKAWQRPPLTKCPSDQLVTRRRDFQGNIVGKNQDTDILKLKRWVTSANALELVTHDNAELLALSGPRNPTPGKLDVVEDGALGDLPRANGDPIANLDLIPDPRKSFVVIMKYGQIYKNTVQ